MTLFDFTKGHDNNFNLIRMLAAYAVLITHSFALTIGTNDAEPLHNFLGMTIGGIAVDVFFLISGFLVTASLLSRQRLLDFAWARIVRIFPAFLAMQILTVIGLGLFFSTLPIPDYFSDPRLYKYLLKSLTLITNTEHILPGVFESNPYKNAVNGSLWSLTYEARMYIILAAIWAISKSKLSTQSFKLLIVTGAVLAGMFVVITHFSHPENSRLPRLYFMFFTGSAFFLYREKVVMSGLTYFICLGALVVAAINQHTFIIIYMTTIAYIVLYTAYVPAGIIRRYNGLGDYSYGVYIYAFPVQQSIISIIPGISTFSVAVCSSAVTILFAVLSWHLLEKHSLKLKTTTAMSTTPTTTHQA